MPTSSKPVRWPRRVLRSALALVILIAGLELGMRLFCALQGRPWNAEDARHRLVEETGSLAFHAPLPGGKHDDPNAPLNMNDAILQPFFGWEERSNQVQIVDELSWYQGESGRATYDILVLGGSVAQSFAAHGDVRLIERLKADPRFAGRALRVHNFGRAGFKEPQQVMLLAYLLEIGHEPDLVLDIDGYNESAIGWANALAGIHPIYPSAGHWAHATNTVRADWEMAERLHAIRVEQERALAVGTRLLDWGAWHSAFLGRLGLSWFEALRRRYVSAYEALVDELHSRPNDSELHGPEYPLGQHEREELIVRAWEQGSRSLRGLCAERGVPFLHMLQPSLHDPGSKPLTKKEIAQAVTEPDWIVGVEHLYPRLREAGQRLSAVGIWFYDGTGVFRDHPEDVYMDGCHVEQNGNEIMADAIAAELLARLAR